MSPRATVSGRTKGSHEKVGQQVVTGNPDPKHISTSYAERQNLTMRMQMRRFTRLTNAFSKKFENHVHMVALYTVWYNFDRQIHKAHRLSPAMAAGIAESAVEQLRISPRWSRRLRRSRAAWAVQEQN